MTDVYLVRCRAPRCRFSVRIGGREAAARGLACRHADLHALDCDAVTVEPVGAR